MQEFASTRCTSTHPVRAIARLAEYQWVMFTSQNAVRIFWEALRASGRPVVFVSGHLANLETMAAVLVASGVPVQVTDRAANNPYVDAQIIAAGSLRRLSRRMAAARSAMSGVTRTISKPLSVLLVKTSFPGWVPAMTSIQVTTLMDFRS